MFEKVTGRENSDKGDMYLLKMLKSNYINTYQAISSNVKESTKLFAVHALCICVVKDRYVLIKVSGNNSTIFFY